MARPNIVLIMADQLAPQFTSTYGHPLVKTPNLDALAARGARFDAAYCNSPLCAPARFSFMAGRHITKIGAYDNASEFSASTPTFAHYLCQLGYRTCLSGKMHFIGPDQLHGFEERLTTDVYPSDYAWTPDWEHPDERVDKWYHNMDSVKEAGTAATTFQMEYDDEVIFTAKRRLFDYAKQGDTPFAMVVSFIHPHDPYVARPEYWDLYAHDEIDLPRSPRADDPHSRRVREGIEADVVDITDAEIRNARHAYYANTSYVDAKIGELVQTLEEARLLDETVVIFTGDHGDMLGERSLWYKMTMFEHSVRVPLVMAGPTIEQGSVSEPCSLVDLLPTMLDLAAGDKPWPALGADLDGRSLLPVATGGPEDPEAEAVAEYCAECASHPIVMIRRGRYKYIASDIDPPMLFDIEADPMELDDLADHPDHIQVAVEFGEEVSRRWDSDAIRADVLASQRARRAVYEGMQRGERTAWDYQPARDATEDYVRNHKDWTKAAVSSRFPPRRGQRSRS